eukprot:g830.t1
MWPKEQEHYYQIVDLESAPTIEATDFVTSFEVAEHLEPSAAEHFVGLLTMHTPKLIFFGAATPFQDRGKNPSHINENTFEYWIEHFATRGYRVDWSKTAKARHKLLALEDPNFRKSMRRTWWYPKNLLIFGHQKDSALMDRALLNHPYQADMLASVYLDVYGHGEFGNLWRRDWTLFGKAFYYAQEKARKRVWEMKKRKKKAKKRKKKAKKRKKKAKNVPSTKTKVSPEVFENDKDSPLNERMKILSKDSHKVVQKEQEAAFKSEKKRKAGRQNMKRPKNQKSKIATTGGSTIGHL